MKKKPNEMSPKEHWNYIHSQRNINGLIKLNQKEHDKMMCHARGLKYANINRSLIDCHNAVERLASVVQHPFADCSDFQCLEYDLSQLILEVSEVLSDAAKLQEHLHGLRMANKTVSRLIEEKEAGNPNPI